MGDSVLLDSWMPVTNSRDVTADEPLGVALLDTAIVLWRSPDGTVHAARDQCPHRGAALSLGQVRDDTLMCPYHGWVYDRGGQCIRQPASPGQTPPANARLDVFGVCERYGVVFVALGDTPSAPPEYFTEWDEPGVRQYHDVPVLVHACGPRIVENFLDMAHFGFVHAGILGDAARAEVRDYKVGPWSDGAGGKGIIATDCWAWQPQTNSLSHGGSDVEYTYRVVRPLTAILTKLPQAQAGFREAISLHVQPVEEEASRAWMVLALTNFVQDERELREFQDRIFAQDRPILENQVPRRLPLDPGAELPVRCDRMSVAYRRYLREKGLTYGVIANAA
jgi:phenylpropionate dioxygenase-like ring-hydroxylating dioxygenase large terminal subunit